MSASIHVWDVGTAFRTTINDESSGLPIPLGGASALVMVFSKPAADENGEPEVVELSAELYSQGSGAVMQYVTEPGVLDRAGTWKVQGVAYFGAGRPVHGTVHKFKVLSNLKAAI